jgi:23S rRNA pseudouridine1911/1915/1917 synthase
MIIPDYKNLCFLQDFDTLEKALLELPDTNRKLLKNNLSKKQLNSPVKKEKPVYVPLNILNRGKVNPVYCGPKINIIHEDENLIAIEKPEFIHGHPLVYEDQLNCLSYLRNIGRHEVLKVNEISAEKGMLYRLDLSTSGLLVFLTSDEMYQKWRSDFSTLVHQKIYAAIVQTPGPDIGEYKTWLKPYGPKGSKMVVAKETDEPSFPARLKIIDKIDKENHTLLKIELQTGLRHQIRSQLSSLGFPILGDELYGGEKSNRIYLHAYNYIFDLPGTHSYNLKAELPELFLNFLDLNRRF